MKSRDKLTKIAFSLPEAKGSIYEAELLWAMSLPNGRYVIDNSPFSAFGISWGDEVRAETEDGVLRFRSVTARGKHSTYRVRLPERCDHECFLRHRSALSELGCKFEGSSGLQRVYAIDVPRPQEVSEVYDILEKYEVAGVWEFEEAHFYNPMEHLD